MNCWTCNHPIDVMKGEKISFRAVCDHCGAALHCCQNCKYYKPGAYNDCSVPGTDYVSDRSKNNFCEEFAIQEKNTPTKNPKAKNRFDDLFKS